MATDDELDDARVLASLGRILATGDPYVALPLVDPDTDLFPEPTVTALRAPALAAAAAAQATADAAVPSTARGAADGVAELDEDSVVPVAQIPVQAIADDPILTGTIGAGVVSAVFPGIRVLFIGDSVTNGSNAENAAFAFPAMSVLIAGSAYIDATVSGNPGLRADQILTVLQGMDVSGFDHIHVQVGTNNASQLGPLAQFQTAIIGFHEFALAEGKSMSFGSVIPTAASRAAEDAKIRLYNAWLPQWARKVGRLVADTFMAIADPATGFLDAAYDSDTVHPNRAGHLELAKVVAPVATARVTPYVGREFMPSALGLLSNPLFAGTTGWTDQGGTASATVAAVPSEPGDGLAFGNWLQMIVDASASGVNIYNQRAATLDNTKYSAGDVLMVTAKIGHNGGGSAKLQITNNAVAFAISADISPTVETPGPVLATFTVPASPGTLRCGLVVTALAGEVATAWLGECQITNLTTGGLVNDF